MSIIGGALIGGALGLMGGERQNQSSARQAHEQMAFQERMSSTAHQREVADLKAAGLNPVLSGTGGHGASSPAGAMAPMQDSIGRGLAGAQDVIRNKDVHELAEKEKKIKNQQELSERMRAQILSNEQDLSNAIYGPARDTDTWHALPSGIKRLANATIDQAEADARDARNRADLSGYSAFDSKIDYDINREHEGLERGRRILNRGAGTIGGVAGEILPLGRAARAARNIPGPSSAAGARRVEPVIRNQNPRSGTPVQRPYKVDPETGEIRPIRTHPR